MAALYKFFCFLLWIFAMTIAEMVQCENSGSNVNSECYSCGADDIKIAIFSRRNKTGQLFAQVRLQEGSSKKSSWQVDIDHDSSCGSASREWNRNIRESTLDGIGHAESPRPLYELVHGLGYYKFHNKAKNWYEAKQICENEGAHLAIINSREESELLQELYERLPKLPNKHNFLGVDDVNQDGKWLTIFNEELNHTGFVEWHSGEPDRRNGEDCLGLNSEVGKLVALKCTNNYGFYCELEL